MKMKFVWLDQSILNILRLLLETVLQDNTSDMVNVILACQDMLVLSSLTRSIQLTWPLKEDTNAQLDTIALKVLSSQSLAQLEDSELTSRLNLKTNVTSVQMDNSIPLKLLILALLAEEELLIMKTTLDVFAKETLELTYSLLPSALALLVIWSQILHNLIKLPRPQAIVSQSLMLSVMTKSTTRLSITLPLVSAMTFANFLISVSEKEKLLDTTTMTLNCVLVKTQRAALTSIVMQTAETML